MGLELGTRSKPSTGKARLPIRTGSAAHRSLRAPGGISHPEGFFSPQLMGTVSQSSA